MPVAARDMNGYRDFEHGHLRTSSYTNGYDPYRRDREDFRDRDRGGRHNGYDDYEQNSYDGGMRDGAEMSFEVDHLATYTSKSGTTRPEDGLTKLKQMESSTGIWTMRCTMIIEKSHIVIIDKGNGEELERFPLSQVQDPTAVLKNDRKETYNNIVMFTVVEDPRNRKSPSDMHIFQSCAAPAHNVVDEILASKGEPNGPRRGGYEQRIPPPPVGPAPEPPYGKSLIQSKQFEPPPFKDEPIEARLRNTTLGDTRFRESRFNDASQWINEYNSALSQQQGGQSGHYSVPYKGSVRMPANGSVRSVQAQGLDYPDYAIPAGMKSGSYTMEGQKGAKSYGKGGNMFGTWSGRQLNKSGPKKGKKWYKFNFSKNSVRKSKSLGKENDGFSYSNSTLPLTKSSEIVNYPSLRLQNVKQDNDLELRNQWQTTREWETGNEGGRFASGGGGGARASYFHHTELDTGQNEALEKDVQLLNNCFDDIEKFVSRLQQAAEAYKELERRRVERGNKRKNKLAGDGMLTMRARPPPAEDFVDIFQKFKFAFNLLAKLKAHIHDPNAPELVHFLFTPLSLIYEASRDPIHNNKNLSAEAVTPLLLLEAKQLLLNCLTSKELELWQRLGKPWTLTKDEWHGHIPSYSPRFYNGWQPSLQADDFPPPRGRTEEYRDDYRRDEYRDFRATERPTEYRAPERPTEYRATERPTEYRPIERDDFRNTRRDEVYTQEIRPREDLYSRNDYRSPSPPTGRGYSENKRMANTSNDNIGGGDDRGPVEANLKFAQELKQMGATIYEAVHDRQSKHSKELTVKSGDIFQVLDSSRNWWKLKNNRGDVGHAPYTILKEYQPRDDYNNGPGRRLSGEYNSYINGQPPPAPPPPGSNRGGRGDARKVKEEKIPQQMPVRSMQDRHKYADDLHHELRHKMNTSDERSSSSPRSPPVAKRNLNITQYSSEDDVTDWLESKGFSQRCVQLLRGYNGSDMFGLHKDEFERLLGRDEGRHLDSLLMVQKNNSGYRKSGASELKAILERRKERMNDDERFGSRPSFMPETPPDYSPPPSEASSDDFGDAGKTLRHLLERQRKKIQSNYYRQYD